MSKGGAGKWLAVLVVLAGLLLAALQGLEWYMGATAEMLHPNPQRVPSETRSAPPPSLAGAVEHARQIVRASLSEQNLPGLSVAVGAGGDLVWAEGFGFADLEKRAPVTPFHRFRIGTASQVLTSAAAGLLLDEGRLKLDDPIEKYVPAFPRKESPVTLRHLMAHTAGIRTDSGDEGPLFGQQCASPVEALPEFANKPLLFTPGTSFKPSDYGWILVSAAVEAAAGEPFLAYMRKRVFEPLGMRDTLADCLTEPIADRATFYFPRFAADPKYGLHLMRPVNLSCYSGSSVFLSTPSDLVRFGLAVSGGKLLRPDTVRLLQTSQRLPSGEDTGYGLGWDLETVGIAGKPTRVVGHDGETLGGMVASLVTLPSHGIVVAVASNISYADAFSIAVKIAEAFAAQGRAPAHKGSPSAGGV